MATFNPQTFLNQVGNGKTMLTCPKKQMLFSQGDVTDAVFYVQAGKVKLTTVSPHGKEAVIVILEPGSFFGEGGLAGQPVHLATATTVEDARIVRIDKQSMLRLLQDDRPFAALFLAYMLARIVRIQEDLVDQLFNSSEKRLARALLLMAHFGKEGKAGRGHSEDQAGNTGRDDREHALSRQFLHESVQKDGPDSLRWRPPRPQFSPQYRPPRLGAQLPAQSSRRELWD